MESSILVKSFALLEATADRSAAKSLGELAAIAGLNKSNAHRILKALTALGYVERLEHGRYRQTDQVLSLVHGPNYRRLLSASAPYLQDLHASTQETVNLGVLRLGKIHYLHVMESTRALRRVSETNSVDPFYCTALGRAIVSHLSSEQREMLVRTIRPTKCTTATVTDREELRLILEQAAKSGYAIERDQTDLGVSCIGAPIFEKDRVVAAISLSIPTARSSDNYEIELVEIVCSTAKEITNKLSTNCEIDSP